MPTIDRLKAEIAFHEKMFFAAIAGLLALIGWLAGHYTLMAWWLVILGFFGILGIVVFGLDQYRRIKRLLVELEQCP